MGLYERWIAARHLMTRLHLWIAAGGLLLIVLFFVLHLHGFLTLEALKQQQAALTAYHGEHPVLTAAAYCALYVLFTSLFLPGTAVLMLAGGAVFGLVWGTILVSFASSVGATLAFLAGRFLFREAVRARLGARLSAIDAGIAREGAFYLFTLRLVPVSPFFLVNLAMGVTTLPVWTFYWVSQVGMLPATIVYVNAGTELARIDSLASVFSLRLIASFALLGVFPLIARKIVAAGEGRRTGH